MKLLKLVVACTLFMAQTVSAVWWNPFTWFSCCDEQCQHHLDTEDSSQS
jgi:hypothetical protein